MHPRRALPLLACFLCGCFGGWSRFDPARAPGFSLQGPSARPHYTYVPRGAAPAAGWPIILFLHGGGESGTVAARPTQVGLGLPVARSDGKFPFVVLFPQCPRGTDWTSVRGEAVALAALDDALGSLPVDASRVYVVGNSMGAHGSLLVAARHQERFAAVVAVAGRAGRSRWFPTPPDARELSRSDPHGELAHKLAHVPVWLFHGEEDAITPKEESQQLATALRTVGAEVRLSLYGGAGHAGSWERAWEEPALFAWLLAHRLR